MSDLSEAQAADAAHTACLAAEIALRRLIPRHVRLDAQLDAMSAAEILALRVRMARREGDAADHALYARLCNRNPNPAFAAALDALEAKRG